MKTWIALVALATFTPASFAPAVAAPAKAKTASCKIKSADGRYTGPCAFTPTGKGSFSVAVPARGRKAMGATDVSVDMVGPGKAEVRGLTTDGINSRWGTATRSKKDRACWVGQDFSVCVV